LFTRRSSSKQKTSERRVSFGSGRCAWVGVAQRVVQRVGVPVQGLLIEGAGDDCVGADEPGEAGVVITGVVEVEAGFKILLLTGVEIAEVRASLGIMTPVVLSTCMINDCLFK